jgi:prepilin-type N-terminal cleavage/methylation domain-containing protein
MAPEDDAMTGRTTRRGFTLIELLVVLAILAVLASLVLAAVLRTRTAQQNRTTESHLKKMEAVFARQRTAVFDTALTAARNNSIPPVVMALAANDPERAKTLWHYIKYRRAFPDTFKEASQAIVLTDPNSGLPVTLTELAAPKIFSTLPPDPTGNGTNAPPQIQAAACAYLFLSNRAERGEVMDMTEAAGSLTAEVDVIYPFPATPQSQTYKVKVFKDTFGNPITFVRFLSGATVAELNASPYATVKAGGSFLDPLDPLGRLTKNPPTNPMWDTARNAQQNIDLTKLAYFAATGLTAPAANQNPFAAATWPALPANNWTGTFVSPGQDGKFGTGDDIFGYRVRQGN